MVKVKISEKGGQQSNYDFDKPEVTIGRMKGNDIVLPKENVSKKHARIYGRNGTLMIDDLDSTNGTYVNGRKVTSEHEITENDKIYIGDFILQVTPEPQQQQQQAGAPPQNPPSPPGGGSGGSQGGPGGSQVGARSSQQNPAPGVGQSDNAPPSPPDSGAGSAPDDVGGSRGGSGDPLSSLDEKYGGSEASPSSQSGARSRGAQQGPATSSPGGGSRPGSGNRGGSAPDGGRSRSSTRRDNPVRDPSGGDSADGPPSPRGQDNRSGAHTAPDPGDNPPQSSGNRAPADSGPSPAGGGRSMSGSRPAADESGASGPSSRPSPQPSPDKGRQRKVSREREANDLRADQKPEGPVGQPVLPPDLESEFDEDFASAQDEVVDALFEEIVFEDLPLAYPAEEADREDYQTIVRDTVREVKPRRVDREKLIDVFTSECVGLGPLEDYLDDPDVQNIYVNQFDRIVVRRDNDIVLAEHAFSHPDFLELAARRLLGTRDPEVMTDEIRFGDGTFVHVTLPPVSVDGPVLTVRKPPADHPTLEELVEDGVMSDRMRTFLERAVETGRSILVAGPTSSGKTTLLEALGRAIPDGSRIIAVEENSQLELPQEGVVRLEARAGAGYGLEELLDAAVEMHPEKILLDECRGAEAYTWVSSAASGTDGSMATVHGINASDALGRLESLCLLGSGDISPRGLREQIARAVNLVVVINRANDGSFRVRQVTEVQGVDLDAFRLNDVFYYRVDGTSGAFHPTGYIPLFYEDLRHMGMDVDLDIFRE